MFKGTVPAIAMEKLIRILHDLRAQAASALGARVRRVTPADSPNFPPPSWQLQTAGARTLDNFFEAHLNPSMPNTIPTHWPNVHAWEIPRAFVTGDDTNVFLPNGDFVDGCPSLARHPDRKLRRPIPPLATHVENPCLLLGGRNFENHGHFVLHHLPRLAAALPQLERRGVRHLLLGHRRKGFQERYVQAVSGNELRILRASPGTTLVTRLFYAPQLWSESALASPDILQSLRVAFLNHANSNSETVEHAEALPILISRADAPDRRLLNEEEIATEIRRQWGACRILRLSELTFAEQVHAFRRAPLIVGALGQGFANLIVASPRSLCLILDTEPDWAESYFSRTFRDLALLQGAHASRLFAGVQIRKRDHWSYPIGKFRRELEAATRFSRSAPSTASRP